MVYCLNVPDNCRILTEDGLYTADASGDRFIWKDVQLSLCLQSDKLVTKLTGACTPIRSVALRWTGDWPKTARYLGDAVERNYGTLEWRGMNITRLMPWYFASFADGNTECYGVMTGPDAFAVWQADGKGVTLWLDTRSGGKGVILGSKEICPAIICQKHYEHVSAFKALQQFCRHMCDAPLLPQTFVYGSNNWYYAYGNTDETEFMATVRETAELSQEFPVHPYVIMDDGWQELAKCQSAAGRPYRQGNPSFPDMGAMAEKVISAGCIPGLWFRPAENNERFWKGARIEGVRGRVMDMSVSSGLEAVAEDVDRFVSWGYKLLKYDFVCKDLMDIYIKDTRSFLRLNGWALSDPSITNAVMIKNMCRTIRKHAKGAILIACNVPSHLAAGEAHIQRGGDDTNSYDWYRTLTMGVNTLAFRLCQHNAFYAMDADCVGIVQQGIDWSLNGQFLDLLSRSGTPLFISAK